MIKLFNSYTNNKEELIVKDNKVDLYVCGPTVYNYIHIGNARPIIVFDILRRSLEFQNITVEHTSNFTDIDDKIIKQAKIEKTTEKDIAEKYIKAYNEDTKKLNVLKPHHQPLVTGSMEEIIDVISKLLKNKVAYIEEKTGDVYFDISKIKDYGKLANTNLNELIENANNRIEATKGQGLNFVLWKITSEGITFDSPWGKGRPGWHTECVAMIFKQYQKDVIDIHGGGLDLKFPHHTNEIAQAKGINNKRLANFWMHNGFVNFESEKMSKSLGNVVLLRDALSQWNMGPLKLLFISTHYQKPIKYSVTELQQNTKVFNKIQNVLNKINQLKIHDSAKTGLFVEEALKHLNDNLNTSNALTQLYAAIKEFNKLIKENDERAKNIGGQILSITYLLGLR